MEQPMEFTSLGFSYPNGHGNYNLNNIKMYCLTENVRRV